jgi:hypothetical protein
MPKYNLIGVGTNAKTIKGDGSEYLTAILYLAPAKIVEGINMCAMAIIAGCASACLYSAGRGAFNSVQQSRIRKTILYRDNRKEFNRLLCLDLDKFQEYCIKKDIQPVVRLNGTSDRDFMDIIRQYPLIQFYDYTKVYNRLDKDLPSNYHITLSYSETNMKYADSILNAAVKHKANMAVVFRDKNTIPATFKGMPVIDGDKDDLRFLDPNDQPYVVALYAKGQAKKDYSGFIIDVKKGN